jgi:hypothetical protein
VVGCGAAASAGGDEGAVSARALMDKMRGCAVRNGSRPLVGTGVARRTTRSGWMQSSLAAVCSVQSGGCKLLGDGVGGRETSDDELQRRGDQPTVVQ